MPRKYYAGHDFKWMTQFLKAIPENKRFSKSIAHSIACAIHHQVYYKKYQTFSLPHSLLKQFGVNPRQLPKYLFYFQKAGLILYTIKCSSSPKITLLLLPHITIKRITNELKYTVQLDQMVQGPTPNGTGDLHQMVQVENSALTSQPTRFKPTRPTNQPKETSKEGANV